MKLAAYLHSAPPHRIVGGERMTLALLEKASQAGWDVSIVAETFIEEVTYRGIKIVPAREKTLVRYVLNDAKAVVTHPELIKRFNIENVVGIVHNLSPSTVKSVEDHSWRALIANSHGTAKDLARLGIKHTHILRPPVLEPRFITPYRPDYVMSTNLSLLKGADVFIEAAKALPQIPFLGVIGGYNEQELPDLKNMALAGHGPLDFAFNNTKIFVSPSRSETYGMAIAEALSVGIPVVVTDIPAHREVAGEAGIFVSLNAPQKAWNEAIDDLYNDQTLWDSMHAAALARGEELKTQTQIDYAEWLALLDML